MGEGKGIRGDSKMTKETVCDFLFLGFING
jgi:hypothetical protein